jgi:hypothetical protein
MMMAVLLLVCGAAPLLAGDPPALCDSRRSGLCDAKLVPEEPRVVSEPRRAPEARLVAEPEWSFEVGSGVMFSNVRSQSADGYTLVPAFMMASLKLDDPSDDEGWCRGYTEFAFRAYGMAITHGPESRIVGLDVGPRYNFVQPGWKVVPFIGAMVGFGFADTQDYPNPAVPYGLGQDFNFKFGVNTGIRYDINKDWFLRLMAEYAHFSSAGLSEPARRNRAIDAIGPQLSVGCRF